MDSSGWRVPVAVFTVATFCKLLLVPAYRSTDFEVHRNWLAVTHSLPVSRWYYEDTSEWTLDYPPFFAWFEWLLSQAAVLVDPLIVSVDNLNYGAPSCVLFQRLSVMVSDLTLLYAIVQYCQFQEGCCPNKVLASQRSLTLSLLLLFNYGLFVVDHIHFQYNGFLFGILLLSITRILQGRCLEGALLFAILLNFKHLFLYIAPAYFVYLLKHYCFHGNDSSSNNKRQAPPTRLGGVSLTSFSVTNFVKLAALVIAPFAISFGPFLYWGQLGQVFSRLFPFKRGLCHAYWAPNVWALYNTVDKAMAVIDSRLRLLPPASTSGSSMTSGLVGEMQHQVLPSVAPWVTMVITLAVMMPALLRLFLRPSCPQDFLRVLLLCGYASFLFGWHVHEKAVMIITVPMCLLAVESCHFARIFLLLSTTGHVALFPLLFKPTETVVKASLFCLYSVMAFTALRVTGRLTGFETSLAEINYFEVAAFLSTALWAPTAVEGNPAESSENLKHSNSSDAIFFGLNQLESIYLVLLFLVQIYCLFVHASFGYLASLEFLPLLLTSVSCAVGIIWSWVLCYLEFCTRCI